MVRNNQQAYYNRYIKDTVEKTLRECILLQAHISGNKITCSYVPPSSLSADTLSPISSEKGSYKNFPKLPPLLLHTHRGLCFHTWLSFLLLSMIFTQFFSRSTSPLAHEVTFLVDFLPSTTPFTFFLLFISHQHTCTLLFSLIFKISKTLCEAPSSLAIFWK